MFCTGTEKKYHGLEPSPKDLSGWIRVLRYLAVITSFETEIQTLDLRITNQDSKPLHRNSRWLLIKPIFYVSYLLTIIFINKILKSTL
jgi:hypothetical protein